MKRILSLLLCILLLSGSLAACSEKPGKPDDTTVPAAESSTIADETTLMPEIEIRTFPGQEMKIWYSTGVVWSPYPLEVSDDEINGDIVYSAGYQRNNYMEETFGVKLAYDKVKGNPNDGTDLKALKALESSGDIKDYDLVFTGATPSAQLALAGFYYDLNQSDVINQTAEYYEARINRQVELFGHSYFASGYYSVMNTAAIDVTYVNVDIVEDTAKIQLTELYDLALNNKWTIEKLLEIGKANATPDTNRADPLTDKYSLILSANYCQNIYYDLGGTDVTYNENDRAYEISLDSEKNVQLFEWIQQNINAATGAGIVANDQHTNSFLAHTSPFMIVTYYNIFKVIDSDVNWAFLPTPLIEEGGEYKAYSDAWNLNFAGIPAQCSDLDKAAYLYEMFMRSSYEKVYPAYYQVCFGTRYQRDSVGAQVFDLMTSSRTGSFANIYGLTLTVNNLIKTSAPVGSTLKTSVTVLKKDLKKISEAQ